MAETITTGRGGTGFLGHIIDSSNDAVSKTSYDYRNALSVGLDDGAGGEMVKHIIWSNGALVQADFTTTGDYADAPVGSVLIHFGAKPVILLRALTDNGTIDDWVDASGIAATEIINA